MLLRYWLMLMLELVLVLVLVLELALVLPVVRRQMSMTTTAKTLTARSTPHRRRNPVSLLKKRPQSRFSRLQASIDALHQHFFSFLSFPEIGLVNTQFEN